MSKNELRNVPIGVLFLASFYVFGAFIILTWVFIDPTAVSGTIARSHGFLPVMGTGIVLVVAALALTLAYGLVRLSRWGFILTIIYSMYVCLINLISNTLASTWPIYPKNRLYFGNFVFSALVIAYLLFVRRHFFGVHIGNQRASSHPK